MTDTDPTDGRFRESVIQDRTKERWSIYDGAIPGLSDMTQMSRIGEGYDAGAVAERVGQRQCPPLWNLMAKEVRALLRAEYSHHACALDLSIWWTYQSCKKAQGSGREDTARC